MAKAFQYQQLATPTFVPPAAADPGVPRDATTPAWLRAWAVHRRTKYAPCFVPTGEAFYTEAVLAELALVASQMRWQPFYPDRVWGKINRSALLATGVSTQPVPFRDIMPFSDFVPQQAPVVIPRRKPVSAATGVHTTQPTLFDGILPPPPPYQRTQYPDRIPGRPITAHRMPFFFTEIEPTTFGYTVWHEPGLTLVATTWTEPTQTPIVTTWTEPAITPIVTTWTEVS